MSSIARVTIFSSQFPENVRSALYASLRSRQLNHKFLYDGIKQTQKWLALHEAHSPSRTDPDCEQIYERSFQAVARRIATPRVHVIGLGCGGGQKDTRLLQAVCNLNKAAFYTPCDVSVAMVLTSQQRALSVVSPSNCFPVVCDLAETPDLAQLLPLVWEHGSQCEIARLLACFGMLPNFEPNQILHQLAGILRPNDLLLLSANLAPGEDYSAGMKHIFPQYDNALTRDWLFSFLLDLGIKQSDGELQFKIEDGPGPEGLKRVAAYFQFRLPCSIHVDSEVFGFQTGESFRLFFSYRYTPASLVVFLGPYGLEVREQWLTRSQEEGVFLVSKA
jgi:SAM-dependent methyltransferase